MARHTFGGTSADFVTRNSVGGSVTIVGGVVVNFYSAAASGTHYTDLLNNAGGAATTITAETDGSIKEFQGPSGITVMWADAGGARRVKMVATDEAATYVAAVLPEAFGAVGDGTTDDTTALQSAHGALDATKGGRIATSIGKQYNFTALNITSKHVTIDGPGVLYNGTVNVGVQTGYAPVEMNTALRCGFDRASRSTTVDAISVANSRMVDVGDLSVNNYRALLSFPALSLGGSNEQHSARIKVHGVTTPYPAATGPIDYLVYVNGNTTGGLFSVGDVTVEGNGAVSCNIAHIYSTGGTGALDGLVCTGNTFFFPAYTRANTDKLSHVLLTTTSDMVTITGNNFFEAGYESINCTDARNFVCTGNNIIWSGQRDLKDAVSLTISGGGFMRGIIQGNNISGASKSAVAIYGSGDAGGFTIGTNTTLLTNPYTQYYGVSGLPASFPRYTGASTLASQPRLTDDANEFGNATTDTLGTVTTESLKRLGIRSSLSSRAKTVSVTAANTVVGTCSSATGSSTAYGGILTLAAVDGGLTHSANYIIAIGGDATAQTITVLASNGETTGAAATAPSFTWAINASHQLLATPVASTTGSFNFYATPLGNLRFS